MVSQEVETCLTVVPAQLSLASRSLVEVGACHRGENMVQGQSLGEKEMLSDANVKARAELKECVAKVAAIEPKHVVVYSDADIFVREVENEWALISMAKE